MPNVLTHRPRPACSFHQQTVHGTRYLPTTNTNHLWMDTNMVTDTGQETRAFLASRPQHTGRQQAPTPWCGSGSSLSQFLSSGSEFCAHRQFRDGCTSENLFISWQVLLNTPSQADTPSMGSSGQWVRQKHFWTCPTLVAPAAWTPGPGGQTAAEVSFVTHSPPQPWDMGRNRYSEH